MNRSFNRALLGTCIVIFIFSIRPAYASISWGPEVSVSLPQPLQVGAQGFCTAHSIFCQSQLRYFIGTGYMKAPFFPQGKSLGLFNFEAGVRVFPFGGKFYLLGGLGYRSIQFSTRDISSLKVGDDALATQVSASFHTWYINPGFGLDIPLSERISIGFELGIQLPVIKSGSLFFANQDTGENSDNSSSLEVDSTTAMARIAALPLPNLTLFRLTWFLP